MTAIELQQQVTILEEQIASAERDSKEFLQKSRESDAKRQELKAALASLRQRVNEAVQTQAIERAADCAAKAQQVSEAAATEVQAMIAGLKGLTGDLEVKIKRLDDLLAKAEAKPE